MARGIVTAVLFGMLLIIGCGKVPDMKQKSAFIVLKTPAMRYADQGFVYVGADEVKAEIYGSGEALLRLTIGKSHICTGTFSCLEREVFNRRVLAVDYPADTLERIFRGKPLFDGQGVTEKRNGFTQKLSKPGKYDILYRVLKNETVFHDTINHIVIKIKTLRG